MASKIKTKNEDVLFTEVSKMIAESKLYVAQTVNATITILYWKIGKRINEETLNNKRAEYGKQIVPKLSGQLVENFGSSFSEKNIRRMMQFVEVFPDEQIVVSAIRQFNWTHFTLLLPLKQPLQREFYAEICRVEKWTVRTLRKKIDGMMYERTAHHGRASQRPACRPHRE